MTFKLLKKPILRYVSMLCILSILHLDYKVCAAEKQQSTPVSNTQQYQGAPDTQQTEVNRLQHVYLISDAHCVPEVQKSIYSTLESLYNSKDVHNLFIEGCTGEQDFDYLRMYPLIEEKKEILNSYIQKGVISGVEYFSCTTAMEDELNVFGIEDESLIIRNREALSVLNSFAVNRRVIEDYRSKLVDWFVVNSLPELHMLLKKSKDMNYAQIVENILIDYEIAGTPLEINGFAYLFDYFDALGDLKKIHIATINQQIYQLSRDEAVLQNAGSDRKKIQNMLLAFIMMNPKSFSDNEQLILSFIDGNDAYSELANYLKLHAKINATDYSLLSVQIDSFIQKHLYSLCQTEQQQHVLEMLFLLDRIERLLSMDFTNSDSQQLFDKHIVNMLYAASEGLPEELLDDYRQTTKAITPAIFAAVNFYDLAIQRDGALRDIFMSYYQSLNSPCALVLGGFHIKGISSFLLEHNIPYTILSPQTENIPDSTKKVYIQHFSDEIMNPVGNAAYNKNFLGAKPILSLSTTGLVGPPAMWFNEILSALVEAIKPFSDMVTLWLNGISQSIIRSSNKVKTVILLVSLANMLGFATAPAMAQDPSMKNPPQTPPSVTRTYKTQVAPIMDQKIRSQLIMSDSPKDIQRRIKAYDSDMEILKEQVLIDLKSAKPALQKKAVDFLFTHNDIATIISTFETSTDLDLKEIIINKSLAAKRYDLLARMFTILHFQTKQDPSVTQLDAKHVAKAVDMFDTAMLREAYTHLNFLDDIQKIKDTSARQKLKFMLAFYVQQSHGILEERFGKALVSILDTQELDAMYYAYSADLPKMTHAQQVFDIFDTNIIYEHSSNVLQNLAQKKMIENAFVLNLNNLITKSQKRFTAFIFEQEAVHAQALYDLYTTGSSYFLEAARSYFPKIYDGLQDALEKRVYRNQNNMQIKQNTQYPHVVISSQILNPQEQPDPNLDKWRELDTWYKIENYITFGSNVSRREILLRHYYHNNIDKLTEFLELFQSSQAQTDQYVRDVIYQILDDLFVQDTEANYNLEHYSSEKIKALIYLSRFQVNQGLPPSAFEYLINSTESEYVLAKSIYDKSLASTKLTTSEVQLIEHELKSRFVVLQINQKIDDTKQYPSIDIITDQVGLIAPMRDDLERVGTCSSEELDRLLEKYTSKEKYAEWRITLDKIVEKTYTPPTLLTKVKQISTWPLTVLFVGGTLLMFLIRRYRVSSMGNDKIRQLKKTQDKKRDPLAKEIDLIENFASKEMSSITQDDLKNLDDAILKLKKDIKFLINFEIINKLFTFLSQLYHNERLTSGEKKLVKTLYVNLQAFSQKDKNKFDFFPRLFFGKTDPADEAQPDKFSTFITNMSRVIFFNFHIKSVIKSMDQLIATKEFTKRYGKIRLRIAVLRSILLSTQAMFFLALAFAPFFLTQAYLVVAMMVVMFIIKGLDIILFYIFNQYNDEMRELFEINLSRVAKFDNRIDFAAAADAIANIEAGRWAMISVMMTLISSMLIVSVFTPWFMVPYIALAFLMLLLAQSRIMKKTDLYSPMYDVIIKTLGPVFGLVLNALLEAFVMTNLIEALIKAGAASWIINPMKSFEDLHASNRIMRELINEPQIISEQSWNSRLRTDRVTSKPIEAFYFKNVSSNLKNKASRPVVDDISISIKRGELVFINAMSGMGKSTLGKILAHYNKPKSGETELLVDGRVRPISPHRMTHSALREVFSYLKFQQYSNISIIKTLTDSGNSIEGFIDFVDDFLPNIRHYLDKPIKGMREDERRFILLALYIYMNKPIFLVLDDMLKGLNDKTINLTIHFLDFVRNKYGTTAVFLDESIPISYVSMFDQSYALSAGKLISMSERTAYENWITSDIESHKPQIEITPPRQELLSDDLSFLEQPQQVEKVQKETHTEPLIEEKRPADLWDGASSVKEFFQSMHEAQNVKDNLFTDGKELSGTIFFIKAVATNLVKFAQIDDSRQRIAKYQEYKNGNATQKIACSIISAIASEHSDWIDNPEKYFSLNAALVKMIIAYIKGSNKKQYETLKSALKNIPEDHVTHFVIQDMQDTGQNMLVMLLADTMMYIEAFASEDMAHQMKLWQDFSSEQATDAERLTAQIIPFILSQETDSFEQVLSSFSDPEKILGFALDIMQDSSYFSKKYQDCLNADIERIHKAIEFEILKRHYSMVSMLFGDTMNEASLLTLNASPLSTYELWGIKKLFDQFGIDYSHYIEAITGSSYIAFRSKVFTLLEKELDITVDNLNTIPDEPQTTYPSRTLLLEKLKLINESPGEPIKPSLPSLNAVNPLENAA